MFLKVRSNVYTTELIHLFHKKCFKTNEMSLYEDFSLMKIICKCLQYITVNYTDINILTTATTTDEVDELNQIEIRNAMKLLYPYMENIISGRVYNNDNEVITR